MFPDLYISMGYSQGTLRLFNVYEIKHGLDIRYIEKLNAIPTYINYYKAGSGY